MVGAKRRQPGNVLGPDVEAFGTEAIERRIHVDRVPQNDEINDETEGPKLVFLPFAIGRLQFTAPVVKVIRAGWWRSSPRLSWARMPRR